MLGWTISVYGLTPEQLECGTVGDRLDAELAYWEVGYFGLDWLTELVAAGKAKQVSHGGYPNRHVARAGDVLPLLADGVPDDNPSQVKLYTDRMAACPADQVLTIVTWDQS